MGTTAVLALSGVAPAAAMYSAGIHKLALLYIVLLLLITSAECGVSELVRWSTQECVQTASLFLSSDPLWSYDIHSMPGTR